MGVLGCWYRDFLDAQTHAVVPYAQALGEAAVVSAAARDGEQRQVGAADGTPVDALTGEIVWGTVGTNGQHAYFQLLHQGTTLVPIDFIGFDHPQPGHELGHQQDLLVANLFAQAEALAFGTDDPSLPPYRVMPGNRPSSTFMAPTAHAVRAGRADRRVRAQGDDARHDLGDRFVRPVGRRARQGARAAASRRRSSAPIDADLAHDASTNALIRRYRGRSS